MSLIKSNTSFKQMKNMG